VGCAAQVKRVFALARPGLLEACNPELQALFRAVIYAFSIWVNKQTPGNMFMNLVFANSYAADTPRPPRSAARARALRETASGYCPCACVLPPASFHRGACPGCASERQCVNRLLQQGAGHKDAVSTRPLTRNQRLLHGLLFVVLPWLLARGERVMAQWRWGERGSGGWRKGVCLAVERSQAVFQLLSTVNLLVFLRFGR
jgi:hypothetical protein